VQKPFKGGGDSGGKNRKRQNFSSKRNHSQGFSVKGAKPKTKTEAIKYGKKKVHKAKLYYLKRSRRRSTTRKCRKVAKSGGAWAARTGRTNPTEYFDEKVKKFADAQGSLGYTNSGGNQTLLKDSRKSKLEEGGTWL